MLGALAMGCFEQAPMVEADDGDATEGAATEDADGSDDAAGTSCEERVEPAGSFPVFSDVVISVDAAINNPDRHVAFSDAFQQVEGDWGPAEVNVALVSEPVFHLPLSGDCDYCGPGCEGPVAVHYWTDRLPPMPPIVAPLLEATSGGALSCVFRGFPDAIRHYVLFTNRDPSEMDSADLDALAGMAPAGSITRFHLAYSSGCDGPGGEAFSQFVTDSGGSVIDYCVDPVPDFLAAIGRQRHSCAWMAPPDLPDDGFIVRADDLVGTEDVDYVRVAGPEACGDVEAEFFVEGGRIVMCPVGCNFILSVPIEDYELQHVYTCAE